MPVTRSDLHRLDRVGAVRQTLASVAETRVREAEARVRDFQLEENHIARNIRDTRAENAQCPGFTGHSFQQNEKYIKALEYRRKMVLQSLEKARETLEAVRKEWVEARREHRIIERLQERRLQEWQREEDIAQQKSADDAFIGRLVRSRTAE